jgi:hypothetical protein
MQSFAYRVDQGNLLRGWVLAMQEDAAPGIALIRQGLVAAAGMSFNLYRPYFLILLAEAYGRRDSPRPG